MPRPPRRHAARNHSIFNPEINRELLALILISAGGLAFLSLIERAGVAGEFLGALLSLIAGSLRYLIPPLLFGLALAIFLGSRPLASTARLLGSLLLVIGLAGLAHLRQAPAAMAEWALQGYGGGLLGLAAAWPLSRYLGPWGAGVVLGALGLAGIIIILRTARAMLAGLAAWFVTTARWLAQGPASLARYLARIPKLGGETSGFMSAVPPPTEAADAATEPEETRPFRRRALRQSEAAEPNANNPDEMLPPGPTRPRPSAASLPPLSLLRSDQSTPTAGDLKAQSEIIRETLHHFGLEVEMATVRIGPTVTQYALRPAKGVKLSKITALSNDLALALAAHPIRIEAPIPGQALVGVEVPNQKVALVTLRELLESADCRRSPEGLTIALGKDVSGKVWCADLGRMPHLLIAGATGSGKTVCLNTIIASLLFQHTPDTLRFLMIDPKRVELTLYNGIPHLLTPVITDAAKTVSALKWAIGEMDRRFDALAAAGSRDVASYNQRAESPLPLIVVVIDELADLMAASAAEVEAGIIRLAQMARAVGIHLVVATQRPSVEVITGLIKANIPARIAFSVAALIDSRTILDTAGAEKLLGRGDLLLVTPELSKPKRLQGAFISENEIKQLVNYWKGDEPPVYDESILAAGGRGAGGTLNLFGGPPDDQDQLFEEARRVVLESGKASASLLQRRLKVGYARAARLLDELEEAGIVGPGEGAKPREIFTEHLAPEAEEELAPQDQTLDAGGTVFNDDPNPEPPTAQ